MQAIKKILPSSLDLGLLRTLALVIEVGSFSAAAEKLGITQPAVSAQMRQLERRLSVRLIERVGRHARPTAAGADLLAHLPHIEAAVEAALGAVAPHALGVTGRVRLGTGATACLYFLPSILRRLHQEFPALSVVVSTGNTDDYVRRIEENTLDLALVTLPAAGRSLALTPILEDEFVAVCPVGEDRLPVKLTPDVLQGRPLLLFEPRASTRRLIDDWFAARQLKPQPVMELGSVEAIKELVAAGLGWSILPKMAVAGRGARSDLEVRPLRPRLQRTLALIVRRDKPLSKGLQQVFNAIVQEARRTRRP